MARQPLMENGAYQVYCGIDFGTHGTAYAFCTPEDPNPRAQQNWGGGITGHKTRTDILLNPQQQCIGRNGFGNSAYQSYISMEPNEQRRHYFFHRFKMALYRSSVSQGIDETDDPVEIQTELETQDGRRVSSETILVEALKYVVSHVLSQTQRMYEIDDAAEIQWVITVPAIWSQRSRLMMKEAAHDAGIPRGRYDQVIVALEPECASITVVESEHLAPGQQWMLVDCGGGTVDIACHELDEDNEIKEIHFATGGPWGSTYIDDEWLKFLRLAFGNDVYNAIQQAAQGDDPSLIEELTRDFSISKENAVSTEETRTVPIHGLRDILADVIGSVDEVNALLAEVSFNGATGVTYHRRGHLIISRAVWDALFDIVVSKIIRHIRSLLTQPHLAGIDTICVVGGFAQSDILISALRRAFAPDNKRVLVPNNPILAVVTGAAKFGVNPLHITQRIAPKTIGIRMYDAFQATDPADKRVGFYAKDVFDVFVKRDQDIRVDMEPVLKEYISLGRDRCEIPVFQMEENENIPRFVPEGLEACGCITLTFPDGYEYPRDKIFVTFDFSGRLVRVQARRNEEEPEDLEVVWT